MSIKSYTRRSVLEVILTCCCRPAGPRLTYRCRFLTKNTKSVTWMTVHTIWKLLMMFSPPLRCPSSELLSFAAHLFSSWSPIKRSRCANGSGAHPCAHTESPSAPKVCSTGRQHILSRALYLAFFFRCCVWLDVENGVLFACRWNSVCLFLSALWFIKVSHGLGFTSPSPQRQR